MQSVYVIVRLLIRSSKVYGFEYVTLYTCKDRYSLKFEFYSKKKVQIL